MDLVSTPKGLVPYGRDPFLHPLPPTAYAHGFRPWRSGLVPSMGGAEDDPDPDPDSKDGKDGKEGKEKEQKTFSADYVEALRTESAKYRTELRDIQGRFKTIEEELTGLKKGQQTDEEKRAAELKAAQDRAEAAEQRVRATATRAAVEREARKLEIIDEDVAYRLLDHDKIEYDADGVPMNLETMLKDLVKVKTFLVGKPDEGKKGVPGSPKGDGTAKTKAEVVEQTKKEMAASGRYTI